MSGPAKTCEGVIDPQSRRTLARTAFRLFGGSLFILWPWLTGARPLATALEWLAAFTGAASIFCALVAMLLGQSFARGALNHWDEALAYTAVSRVAHLAHSQLG